MGLDSELCLSNRGGSSGNDNSCYTDKTWRTGARWVKKKYFLKEMYDAERRAGVWGKRFYFLRQGRLAGCCLGLLAELEHVLHLQDMLGRKGGAAAAWLLPPQG